ncbi:MAG: hypothetical protein HKP06_09125 [Flavobacteriaceae bacterium]|nr:hypothetical protein [Flavobacteriaceae bacterium]
MPEEGSTRAFNNFNATHHQPFVIYVHSESYLQLADKQSEIKNTTVINNPKPYATGYYIAINERLRDVINQRISVARLQQYFPEFLENKMCKTFVGTDCFTQFLHSLYNLTERLSYLFQFHNITEIPPGYENSRSSATKCILCGKPFEKDCIRAIDHDHWTGDYVGIAHQVCNINTRTSRRFFPVYFHNFKSYDCHSLCKTAEFALKENIKIQVIPLTTEKYLSLSLKWPVSTFTARDGKTITLFNEIRFLDSCQYLPSSLNFLTNQCFNDNGISAFVHTAKEFKDIADFEIVLRKGVFPYSYFNHPDVLQESYLPPQSAFVDDLNGGIVINDDAYRHAQRVWISAGCSNLQDYMLFYLRTDIMMLTDVFETFRLRCESVHRLDPVFFYSLPGFAWEAALRQTGIELELISDYDMYSLIERGTRGGLTVCTRHHVKTSNHYTDPTQFTSPDSPGSSYVFTLDANSLYAWAMCQSLPYGGFRFLNSEEIEENFQLSDITAWPSPHGETGYILEVDICYPEDSHDHTASYPFMPCHERISAEQYSAAMLKQWWLSDPNTKFIPNENKLIASCTSKKNYVLHIQTLLFYIQHGMILEKIHNIIAFKQKPWLAPYISGNIDKRKTATSTAESDFYKLSNNAVFGKSQEQKRNRTSFQLALDGSDNLDRLISKSSYGGSIIFSDTLAGVYNKAGGIKLDQPLYVGFTILELSKLHMFHFFYDIIKPLFVDDVCEVIYTDTDSLFLYIKGDKIISKLQSIRDEWLDGSNLPTNHPLYCIHNKGVIGKFKDEMDGFTVAEFIGLRPKMYALQTFENTCKKRAKGVKKAIVINDLKFNDYMQVYNTLCAPIFVDQTTLRSQRHQVSTITQRKKALSLFDNKRYWIDNCVSFPYGHYRIEHLQNLEEEARLLWFKEHRCKPQKEQKQRRPYKRPNELILKRKGKKPKKENNIECVNNEEMMQMLDNYDEELEFLY